MLPVRENRFAEQHAVTSLPFRQPLPPVRGFVTLEAHQRSPMRSSTHSPQARARLRLEQLEDRATPAAVATHARVTVVMRDAAPSAADRAELAAAPFAAGVAHLGFGIYRVTLAAGSN